MENGKQHGYGIYEYLNGDVYEGEWKDGLRNGKGIYTTANGKKYEGEWKNGEKQALQIQVAVRDNAPTEDLEEEVLGPKGIRRLKLNIVNIEDNIDVPVRDKTEDHLLEEEVLDPEDIQLKLNIEDNIEESKKQDSIPRLPAAKTYNTMARKGMGKDW